MDENDIDAFVARYGFKVYGGSFMTNPPMAAGWVCSRDDLRRMMSDVVLDARADERERCAKLCESLRDAHCAGTRLSAIKADWCEPDSRACDFVAAWNDAAAAIRRA